MNKLILIDGNSLINRAYYALPPLTNKDGFYTNAIYGFFMMLDKILSEYEPSHMCVAFDLKAPTFRHKEYLEYKGTRKKMPDELAMQIEPLKEMLDASGIFHFELAGYEADDIIGTISLSAENSGFKVYIVTGDKDSFQLISENTKVIFTKKGIAETDIYDENLLNERYNLKPEQIVDLKGLMGDPSDNIPGVKGIGEKTALKLLYEYGSVEKVYQNLENFKGALLKKLEDGEHDAVMSKRLATIVRDIPLEFEIDELKIKKSDDDKLIALYKKYELNSLLKKYKKNINLNTQSPEINYVDFDTFIENKPGRIFFKTFSDTEDRFVKSINEVYLFDGKNFVTLYEKDLTRAKILFEDENIEFCGYDVKADYITLSNYGITVGNLTFDAMIAEYILDPTEKDFSMPKVTEKHGIAYTDYYEEVFGTKKTKIPYIMLDKKALIKYYSAVLQAVYELYPVMISKMKACEEYDLFLNIEMPLISVLAEMEIYGVFIDTESLKSLGKGFEKRISEIEREIFEYAGKAFNINSPKQLGTVLFEDLCLEGAKKTKTGYSTTAEVLEKISEKHPIVPLILEYRQLSKLMSTYAVGLLNVTNPETHRIHTTFNQTVTSTGRISSTDPNLQNIPVRTEQGRELRKAIIAPDGRVLVDADYSQIELRVLAHMADESKMIDGFKHNLDIHAKTASEVFDVPVEEVTKEMRSAAKAVNFGIVYGISDFGLSNNLNISIKEAKDYIDLYLSQYPKIKTYMDDAVKNAEDKGYSTTLFGRRRYIRELKSKNFIQKNLGKRLAMNTPIQGTAADIIKISMNKVSDRLKKENLNAKLILQIHDELIVETDEKDAERVKKLMVDVMENVVKLAVPLKVDVAIGKSWYETK